jgi:galactonate dehydratase
MKIKKAEIYSIPFSNNEVQSLWDTVVLRLTAEDGTTGVGDVSLAYGVGHQAGIGILKDLVKACVIGKDVFQSNLLWHQMYRDTFWGQGGGPVVYGGMSAIDEAVLDLKGKILGLPIYDLLGGKTREDIRVYANGWYINFEGQNFKTCVEPQEYAQAALRTVADGYDALKFDPLMGASANGAVVYPPRLLEKDQFNMAVDRVGVVREAVGPDVDIMVEIHGNLGTTSAIALGRELAQFKPYFYEEPVDPMNPACMEKVSKNVPIPIAGGERLYTRYQFRPFIERQALDILQPDLGLAGGITETKKIAEFAEVYNLHVQPHNCAGPISTAASIQLDAVINNFAIQEWFPYRNELFYQMVDDAYEDKVVNSYLTIPDKPGLGISLNDEFVKDFLVTSID